MKQSLGAKTLIYPTPVWCVGTYDKEGKPNIMTIAWGGICCSKPPCVTISLRKATYTYDSILERKAYTLSVPPENYVKEADYFGLVSGKDTDKFQDSGFTAVKSDVVDAPYVEELPMVLECELIHHYEIGLHTHFVGEIKDVKVEESFLNDEEKPDIQKIKPILFAPELRHYYGVGDFLGKAFSIGKELK